MINLISKDLVVTLENGQSYSGILLDQTKEEWVLGKDGALGNLLIINNPEKNILTVYVKQKYDEWQDETSQKFFNPNIPESPEIEKIMTSSQIPEEVKFSSENIENLQKLKRDLQFEHIKKQLRKDQTNPNMKTGENNFYGLPPSFFK